LEGWQNEWNFIEENFIRINGLPYGQFLLHIKAQNSKGEETLHDLTIPIFVEKPFYLKTWFLVLLIATISGAIIGFFKWRTRQLELDKMLLEKEVADRTQTISGQKVELEKLNATKDRFFTIIAHDMRNAVYNFRGVTDKISFFIERKQPERIHEFGGQINMAVNNLTNLMNNLLDWAILQKGAIAYLPKTINISAIVD
jgi:signal transduction histidine kinase